MPGNATPRFTKQANVGSVQVDAANTNSDGTGNITTPTMYIVFTADATNGSYLDFIRVMLSASAASTLGAATTVRFYISSISSGATTNANTFLIDELALPAITADVSGTATNYFDVPMGIQVPAGKLVLASTHVVSNANTHVTVTAFGGDY